MEIIVSHVNTDFDALAAMVAAQKIYLDAKLVFSGSQNRNVREFIYLHHDLIDFFESKQIDRDSINRVIVVDTKIADRLGELADVVSKPNVEVFTFDHHPPTDEDMKTTCDFSEETGSATTIFVKIIRDKKIIISPFEATLFALGIHEDTGSLTYPTTTYDDAEALAFLMAQKANIDLINYFLNLILTEEQHKLLNELLQSVHTTDVNGIRIMFTSAKATEYVDGASVLTHKIGDLENVDVIFSFIEMKDRIHVIGRSRADEVDVGKILASLGGGGHPQAGSAVVKGKSLKKIEKDLLDKISIYAKRPLTAKEIMSKPVRLVDSKMTIQGAGRLMLRYGHSGLPVVEDDELVGIISRRDVDKAIHHGLKHVPVKGFMSHNVIVVGPDKPIYEIQQLLMEEGIGRVPVVDGGKIIGIITRTDVLCVLHGSDYLSTSSSTQINTWFTKEKIKEKIANLLPKNVQNLLEELGELAKKEEKNVYVVGGFVRDLLLGYRNLDVDIVVEGDGIAFGRAIVEKLGGRIRAHKKFGTAVVILPNGFRIDVASARLEYYERPAALPQVEFASIRHDLARRDFSINAMALALNFPRFGELLDFFGGRRDIKKKSIRVLHSLSFVEDPTRIFRAVRFEQRYGFMMESHTEELAKKAIDMELVGELTNERVMYELVLILSEKTAWKAVERLWQLGALQTLHPKLNIDAELKLLFEQAFDSIPILDAYFTVKTRQWLVLLMMMLRNLDESELNEWCLWMRIKKKDAEMIKESILRGPEILKTLNLSAQLKDSELYFLLKDMGQESIAYIFSRSLNPQFRKRIIHYLTNLKSISTSISGKDLMKLGFEVSPLYNLVLRDLLIAKLDGLVKTNEEEKKFVKLVFEKLKGGIGT
ncbi:CBS domain-containing protein [Candidatus Oleimmundimicrobium sp.]|uniref:CBS domain-containing protein n=1 Tax=Candidatus Oleimmundimicrobium sp. TaxID=3060597 RepID=UPI002726C200|nr:CBS domain-containing protein [Candidatus Oleimmundimicrobium sp.]MDO8886869.1 CBS domain-containing protein [Candidatus Oleimmundimicrobium sp.]